MADAALAALLVAALIVALRLGAEIAVRRWKRSLASRVQAAGTALDRQRVRLGELAHAAGAYTPADPAPYGPAAADLEQALATARDVQAEFARQRRQLLRLVPTRPVGWLDRLWFAVVVEPWRWWQIERQAGDWAPHASLDVQPVELCLQLLQSLPLATARRARAASAIAEQACHTAHELQTAGLRGQSLEETTQTLHDVRASLASLPLLQDADLVHWLQVGHEESLDTTLAEVADCRAATRASTIEAWQMLDRLEEPLSRQTEQLARWQSDLTELRAALSTLEAEAGTVAQLVAGTERLIDAASLVTDMAAFHSQARDAVARATAPSVDDLPRLAQHLAALASRARGLSNEASGLRSLLERLHSILPRIDRLLGSIESRMDELSTEPAYAIDWGAHDNGLKRLRLMQSQLGPPSGGNPPGGLGESQPGIDSRTVQSRQRLAPEQLRKHALLADEVLEAGQTLSRQVSEVSEQREALITLLHRPEVATAPDRLHQAHATAEQAARYAPANWPADLGLSYLDGDINALAARLGKLPGAGERIPAAGLGSRLEELQAAAEEIEPLLQREAAIAARLKAIENAEQLARQSLEPFVPVLTQVADRLRSAATLSGPARAIAALARQGQALLAELDQRDRGRIEDKARKVSSWSRSAHRSLRSLNDDLQAEARSALSALGAALESLKAVAPLDGEPAIRCSRELLAAGRADPAAQRHRAPAAGRKAGPGDAVVLAANIERLLEAWQQGADLLAQLRSEVIAPIEHVRADLDRARSQAGAASRQLDQLKREIETDEWPIRCVLDQAIQGRLKTAQADERRLAESGQTVADARRQADRIAERYRDVVAAASQLQSDVTREHESVRAFALRLTNGLTGLSAYGAASGDPAVAAAVDERVAAVEHDLSSLKRRWASRPPRPEEAIDELRGLWNKLQADLWPKGSRRPIQVRDKDDYRF